MIHAAAPLPQLLSQWEAQRLLTPLDRHFALELAAAHGETEELFLLFCALLSRQLSQQHTCLVLAQVDLANPMQENHSQCRILLEQDALQQALAGFAAVGDADSHCPLILEDGRLYLQRYHQFETQVAARLLNLASGTIATEQHRLAPTLALLFPAQAQGLDWQKIATATALTKQLAVITGGPGTGKTTTVTKLLFLLQLEQELNIRLVAPTGKAAARLSESIKASKARLASELERDGAILPEYRTALQRIPERAATLHRLLGVIPDSHRFRHHKDNPLRLELLIVDEASMVDLPMMHKLLQALPDEARLILLGDQDQLASVEAGAVLADICAGLRLSQRQDKAGPQWRMRYSQAQAERLSSLCAADLTAFVDPEPRLGDSLCMLLHSHRFRGDAGIGVLATAVNNADKGAIMRAWQHGYRELHWFNHEFGAAGNPAQNAQAANKGLQLLLEQAVAGYGQYLGLIHGRDAGQADNLDGQDPDAAINRDTGTIIETFNRYRLLCAMRAGDYGVEGINRSVTQALTQAKLIQPQQEFYLGRPIIIQSNDYNLGLFNGDIGLVLRDNDRPERLMAHFVKADGSILKVLPARLPSHDTCFAMTVHKSQGSEFEQVALVLPPSPSPSQWQLLTKELVYTAVTRAKQSFSCLGSQGVFERACMQATQRASGLAHRLWQQQQDAR
ncbi:exodeoxyribonuclease V subunit alpha [Shewanella sp. AS16]|uniref:exodeoxyribonuclease V subunit alpha n=1 Tax=Shewanella sp. AS16 TaxID=2907625 RepID=UPI001F3150DA|nr:exodeoxyribonuclease V subunit alpha [Shewanella sp. AS16]MCE9687435.1 exodeoxyribonuclease V subunit alpha [Shewanella sp. AS16]